MPSAHHKEDYRCRVEPELNTRDSSLRVRIQVIPEFQVFDTPGNINSTLVFIAIRSTHLDFDLQAPHLINFQSKHLISTSIKPLYQAHAGLHRMTSM